MDCVAHYIVYSYDHVTHVHYKQQRDRVAHVCYEQLRDHDILDS